MQATDQFFDETAHMSDDDIEDVNLNVKPVAFTRSRTSAADHENRL